MARRVRDRVMNPDEDPVAFEQAMDAARLPERYRRATIEAIDPAKGASIRTFLGGAIEHAKDWLGDGRGYYLQGDYNSGKSSAAAILMMDAIKRCEVCLWLHIRDVPMARFREGDRGKELDARLHRADLVVLDDLGSETFRQEGAAGGAVEQACRIVYERERSLIVTSNIGWQDFISTYSEKNPALVSVIRRMVQPKLIQNDQWPEESSR